MGQLCSVEVLAYMLIDPTLALSHTASTTNLKRLSSSLLQMMSPLRLLRNGLYQLVSPERVLPFRVARAGCILTLQLLSLSLSWERNTIVMNTFQVERSSSALICIIYLQMYQMLWTLSFLLWPWLTMWLHLMSRRKGVAIH